MSSIPEVFPPDDPVARFVVAMSMARNDIRHALSQAGHASERGNPDLRGYWVRVANGHFFEASTALDNWRRLRKVQGFINKLPSRARDALRAVNSSRQKLGHKVLEHSRDRTFHYPYPTGRYPTDEELADTLRSLDDVEAAIVSEGPGAYRLQFADHVALALAFRNYSLTELDRQAKLA